MSVEDRFRHIVGDVLNVQSDRITTYSGLRDDLGADSLDLVELAMKAEREFDCMISDASGSRSSHLATQ
jgi:acyl carrier protein